MRTGRTLATTALLVGIVQLAAGVAHADPGVTSRESVSSTGAQGNGASSAPSLSDDGRLVAFVSGASNLVAGDTNGRQDVFVRDRVSRAVTRVSVGAGGAQAGGDSSSPQISGNGRYVVFDSVASELVAGDTNAVSDVFVRDLQAGTTTRVSVGADGAQGNAASRGARISADGSVVAFTSAASDLVAGDTNAVDDVFVHSAGGTVRVSVGSDGTQADLLSEVRALSGDGRVVGFLSSARSLSCGGAGTDCTFVHELSGGRTERTSYTSQEAQRTFLDALSLDGRYVGLETHGYGTRTIPYTRLTVLDRSTGTVRTVAQPTDTVYSPGERLDSSGLRLSADGQSAVYSTVSTTGYLQDQNGVYLDRGGVLTKVSRSSDGADVSGLSNMPAISGNGLVVAYASSATTLVPGDTNAVTDVFSHVSPAIRVHIVTPPPGVRVHGTVPVSVEASPDPANPNALASVSVYVDGTLIGTSTTRDAAGRYVVDWDTTRSPSGSRVLTAVATDSAGTAVRSYPVRDFIAFPPGITSVTAGGRVGATVQITGTSFYEVTAVRFSGAAASFTVDSPTSLRAVVPAGAVDGPVTVTTERGTATSATRFVVDQPPGPVTGLTARPGDRAVQLRWTAPADTDLYRYVVVRKVGAVPPASLQDGYQIGIGNTTAFTDTGLTNGTTYSYRVYAQDRAGGFSTTSPGATATPTVSGAATLSVAATPTTVVYGRGVTFTGRLLGAGGTPGGGEQVELYVRRAGSTTLTYLQRVTTAADGTFSTTTRPSANAQYLVRHTASTFVGAAQSPAVAVQVTPVVSASITPAVAAAGSSPVVRGTVAPAHPGQAVQLQRLVAGAWSTVATTTLTSTSTYAVAAPPTRSGVFTYRVLKPADADHTAATSGSVSYTAYAIGISSIHADAAGADASNLNDEYVVLKNIGSVTRDLVGWRLTNGPSSSTLPSYVLGPNAVVRVHTGSGPRTAGHIYLGSGVPLWPDTSGTGSLFDPRGALVSRYTYGPTGVSVYNSIDDAP